MSGRRSWLGRLLGRAPVAAAPGSTAPASGPAALEAALAAAREAFAAGRLDEAVGRAAEAAALDPASAAAAHLLGVAHARSGDLGAARAHLERACELAPRRAGPHHDLGNVARLCGDAARAEEAYARAARLDPRHAASRLALGALRFDRGDLDGAIEALGDALRHAPDDVDARYRLGTALALRGRVREAVRELERVIERAPEHAAALANLGRAHHDLGRLGEARRAYERAVAIEPRLADAWVNLGNLRNEQGLAAEGAEAYRRALEVDPDNALAHSNLCLSLNYRDDVDPDEVLAEHVRFGERFRDLGTDGPARRPRAGRRLRVGYLSGDLRRHSVAFFIEPVLAAHDRAAVEVFCYSDTARPDAVTARLRERAEHWREVAPLDEEALVARIRADRLDVLVELGGHTAGHRLAALARRAAPVQATWIGYPNTTGLAQMDFRLTDAVADPPGVADRRHTERLVRLPAGFLCYAPDPDAPPVAGPPAPARGLVTFGSFNNANKLSQRWIALAARVLGAVPGSRLVLKARQLGDEDTRRLLEARLAGAGVDPARVEILGWMREARSHLERYAEIDVALDTFPYNGTTTTLEALWMGVPVVTRRGEVHAARVGASLLERADLGDLVAADDDAFVAIASGLAADPDRLVRLRAELRERVRASPLGDAAGFTRALEAAYEQMAGR